MPDWAGKSGPIWQHRPPLHLQIGPDFAGLGCQIGRGNRVQSGNTGHLYTSRLDRISWDWVARLGGKFEVTLVTTRFRRIGLPDWAGKPGPIWQHWPPLNLQIGPDFSCMHLFSLAPPVYVLPLKQENLRPTSEQRAFPRAPPVNKRLPTDLDQTL